MKKFTQEEAKALRGTEFTYEFSDGDTVQAFIAEVDLKVGLTCKALSPYTERDNYKIFSEERETMGLYDKDYNNVVCVVIGETPKGKKLIHKILDAIVQTGRYTSGQFSPKRSKKRALLSRMYDCKF
jgi:hypothetical protein